MVVIGASARVTQRPQIATSGPGATGSEALPQKVQVMIGRRDVNARRFSAPPHIPISRSRALTFCTYSRVSR